MNSTIYHRIIIQIQDNYKDTSCNRIYKYIYKNKKYIRIIFLRNQLSFLTPTEFRNKFNEHSR